MKKTIVSFVLAFICFGANAQIWEKIKANKSIQLGSYPAITAISNDTTIDYQSTTKLITEYAVKKLIKTRFESFTGGGGSIITYPYTTKKVLNGYGNFVPIGIDSVAGLTSALAGKQSTITTGASTKYFRGDLSLADFPDVANAANITTGTLADTRLSGNVPILNSILTAPLAAGIYAANKSHTYITGGLNYNTGSHVIAGAALLDTVKFNGHNQSGYGLLIAPTFVNSGGFAETDRRAMKVTGNVLIDGDLQLTGTLTFPGTLGATNFDASSGFKLAGTTVLNTYWSGSMVSLGSNLTGTLIFNTNNGNHILYANNSANSVAIGQGSSYPTAAPSNGLSVVGDVITSKYRLSALNTAPSSSTDTGILGEIRITATYIYICTATNTWVRSALSTW